MDAGFVEEFERLHAVAYRAAYAVLGSRPDAEDAAQEALARALVRWQRIVDYAPAWVARVATNVALDRVRKAARGRHAPTPAPHDDAVALQRRDLVVALQTLPKRQREAVVLRYVVDLSEAATAAAMGCALGTVKSATARGLTALRAQLGPTWAMEEP